MVAGFVVFRITLLLVYRQSGRKTPGLFFFWGLLSVRIRQFVHFDKLIRSGWYSSRVRRGDS